MCSSAFKSIAEVSATDMLLLALRQSRIARNDDLDTICC